MRREHTRALLLLLGSLGLALLVSEGVLRALVVPSERAYGTVLGVELPPFKLLPATPLQTRAAGPADGAARATDGDASPRLAGAQTDASTCGAPDDLGGVLREDPVLGYAPREGAVSTNGWWHSNNLGARARRDTPTGVPIGTRRILVFGESFAAGSRVTQDAAWSARLEAESGGLEIVNLAVDGYSMAQSFLRYRGLGDRLAYDEVVLMLVPSADLWRDVNTMRSLAAGWDSYIVMPRFVLADDGRLALIPSPYEVPTAVYERNRERPSAELVEHLRRYDRFYSPAVHEEPALFGRPILARLVAGAWYRQRMRRLRAGLLDGDSEAMRVVRAIVTTMDAEVRHDGKRLTLVLLPTADDLEKLRKGGTFVARWDAMVRALRGEGLRSVDLAPDLISAPAADIDAGCDGTHYGPRANALIATLIARSLAP